MNDYYLRIEGVNFDSFVLDTNRIKIVRGGSLMLLNSVDWLKGKMKPKGVNLHTISAGASFGLFRFQAESDNGAGQIAAQVRDTFNNDKRYKHASITIAVQPAGKPEAYQQTRSRLEAISRWQQMQSPSVAIPDPNEDDVKGVCEFDRVRPATGFPVAIIRENGDKEEALISSACHARWVEDGKENRPWEIIDKAGFYEKRTELADLKFTTNLRDLAWGEDYSNLHRKMAVIYLDGNHFGKKALAYCTSEKNQDNFDKTLRKEFQDGALTTLLTEIKDDSDWKNSGNIRLETLLWGGDEIIWVVPAWKGWWMLGRFFEISKDWDYHKISEESLTHGAGLVFCHHNAPIQPILELVRDLGDLAKGDRSANKVAYQVLESFDHAGTDLEAMRNERWPLDDNDTMILDGNAMLAADRAVREIKKSGLPKRQLYRIAKLAQAEDLRFAEEKGAKLVQDAGTQKELATLESCFNPGLPAWLHLLELWDYLGLKEGRQP